MNFKKINVLLVVIALLMGSIPTSSFADHSRFKDVKDTYWANEFIQVLASNGILSGYGNGNFAPESGITREEFAVIIFKTFGLDEVRPTTPSFKDVDASRWSYGYVESAKEYLTGYFPPNGKATFDPEGQASREDVAVALVRALNLDASGAKVNINDLHFRDLADISPNLRTEVTLAVTHQLISGFPDGTLLPNAPVTRAQASAMVYKIIKSTYAKSNTVYSSEIKVPEQVTANQVPIAIKLPANSKLTINDKAVNYDGTNYSGNWKIESPGNYAFKIMIQYPNGKTETVIKNVVYVAAAPIISLSKPVADKVTQTRLNLSFTVKDPNNSELISVTVNGASVSRSYFSNDYSVNLVLKEGYNDILIEAKNKLGLVSTKAIRVFCEVGSPNISSIVMPATSDVSQIKIDIKVTDPLDSSLYLYVNDQKYSIYSDKLKTIYYTLNKGENTLVFKVTNSQNKTASLTKVVTYQTSAPVVTLTSSLKSAQSAYTMTLKVADNQYRPSSLTAKINGRSVSINSYGTISYPLTLLQGNNLITVEVSNPDGKTTTTGFTINYSIAAPVLNVSDIPATTSGSAITISGNVYDAEDPAPVVKVNGEAIPVSFSGNFVKTITLLPGEKTVKIQAINRQGIMTEVIKVISYILVP